MTLDERLHAWATEQRSDAPLVEVPVAWFTATRHWPRTVAMIASAAAVVALAGVVVAMTRSGSDGSNRPGQGAPTMPPASVTPPSPAPAGEQTVTFHGLTVTVPKSWPLNAVRCGTPIKNTVWIADGAVETCSTPHRPAVTSVVFETWSPLSPRSTTPQHDVRLDGVAARRSTTTKDGETVLQFDVPSLAVRLIVTAPSAARADELTRTLQVSAGDENGCPAHIGLVALRDFDGSGSAHRLVTGRPKSAVLCSYFYGYLESSSKTPAGKLASALNALPAGLSEVGNGLFGSDPCWRGGRPGDMTDNQDASSVLLRFRFSDGRVRQLFARVGECGPLGVTNGNRTGQRTQSLIDALRSAVWDYPMHVHPIR